MSKQTGLSWTTLTVDDSTGTSNTDIRNDVNSFDFATPRGVLDVTGVDKAAYERLLGLSDFSITLKGTFNAALSHGVFSTVPTTSVSRTTVLTIGGKTMTAECLYTDYSLSRGTDGSLTWSAPGVLANGTAGTWS
jgi:hypothetical protein